MNLRRFLFAGAVLCSAATALAEAPRVTARALPGWWPASLFGRPSGVIAEDYGEAAFNTTGDASSKTREAMRGRHWKASLSLTPEEDKQKVKPEAEAKWNALREALGAEGFKVVNLQKRGGAYAGVYATLMKGAGADATWLSVSLHQPFRTGELEAVQVAANPLQVELTPPAAAPEKVGDKESWPYLPPPAGEKLISTQHFNLPMDDVSTEPPYHEAPIGSGYLIKTYKVDPTISALAFHDAYTAALNKAGWTVVPVPSTTVFAVYDKNGRDLYAKLAHGAFYLVDQGAELGASLQRSCKAAVYGLNFDFNKATLRPDSEPTLQQVLELLEHDAKLQVEIGGHTDDVGTHAYNVQLSDERAAAVKDWLLAHGIAAGRLSSHGYGDTQPVVPNDSELNRAKNRRVELKKPNCK